MCGWLIGLVYSELDSVSKAAGEYILRQHADELDEWKGFKRVGDIVVCQSDVDLLHCEYLDDFGFESIIIISRHRSEKGIVSFTAHALGNWTDKADLGGIPMKLSIANPVCMREFLLNMTSECKEDINVVYEATHHGPFLKTPSCFLEFGGPDSVLGNLKKSEMLGRIAFDSAIKLIKGPSEFMKVAIGIGGMHYSERFTKLAIEKGYAFAHIMPKYAIINSGKDKNLGMIDIAANSSNVEPDCAVIDWKSINSELRGEIIKRLDYIGLDYERI